MPFYAGLCKYMSSGPILAMVTATYIYDYKVNTSAHLWCSCHTSFSFSLFPFHHPVLPFHLCQCSLAQLASSSPFTPSCFQGLSLYMEQIRVRGDAVGQGTQKIKEPAYLIDSSWLVPRLSCFRGCDWVTGCQADVPAAGEKPLWESLCVTDLVRGSFIKVKALLLGCSMILGHLSLLRWAIIWRVNNVVVSLSQLYKGTVSVFNV